MSEPTVGSQPHLSEDAEANARAILRKPYIHRDDRDVTALLEIVATLDFSKLHVIEELQARELCRNLVLETFNEGQVVFQQGSHGDKFYVVLTGECAVSMRGDGSADSDLGAQERELFRCGPGSSFGERALKFDEPRTATVVAAKRTELLMVTKLAYHRIMGLEAKSPSRLSTIDREADEAAAAAAAQSPGASLLPWREKPVSVQDEWGNHGELSMWDKLQQTAIHAHHTDQLRRYFEEESSAGRPLNRRSSQNFIVADDVSVETTHSLIPSFTPLEPKEPHGYHELKMSLSFSLSNMVGHERPGSRLTSAALSLLSPGSVGPRGPGSCSSSVSGSAAAWEPFSPGASRSGASRLGSSRGSVSSGRPGTTAGRFGLDTGLGSLGSPGRPGTTLGSPMGQLEPLRMGGGASALGLPSSPIAPIPAPHLNGAPGATHLGPPSKSRSHKVRRNPYVEPRLRPDVEEYRLKLIQSERQAIAANAAAIRAKVLDTPLMRGCTLTEARERYRALGGPDALFSPVSSPGGGRLKKNKEREDPALSSPPVPTPFEPPPLRVTKLKNLYD